MVRPGNSPCMKFTGNSWQKWLIGALTSTSNPGFGFDSVSVSGVYHGQAYAWSRTRMGGWAVAQSPILGTTITLARLMKRGYEPVLDYYLKIAPHLNEPLYTRPVRTVV